MRISRLIFIYPLFFVFQLGVSQTPVLFEDQFTEITTEQDKMKIYLDTIDEYLYRDIDLTTKALIECQKIVDNGAILSDSIMLEYVTSQIYYEYSKANPLGAFQKIVDNEDITKSSGISENQIKNFSYLKCFTLHSIGDLEAAQKEYYNQIEQSKLAKDTTSIVRNLHSLGQLFNDEKEYSDAISCFLQVNEYASQSKIRASTRALNGIELSEAYMFTEEYDKALTTLDNADKIADEDNLQVLKSDILMMRGNIYIEQNKLDSAEAVYNLLINSNQGSLDQNNLFNTQRFLGYLYYAKKMYPQALELYKNILEEADSTNLDLKIESLERIHETCKKMNNYEDAYEYVLAYEKVRAQKTADERRQKTAYLKIKYDSERKEKDNAILSAELIKNQAERKYLYSIIALSCLFLIILFGAFYQKARYNKRLEAEVQKRTINLSKSNALLNKRNTELDEFNRILSHDLKEPLRSIISFSQLASRNLANTNKAKEYLGFVMKSGDQLNQLIEDVSIFQNIKSDTTLEKESISIKDLLDSLVKQIQKNYPNRKINLTANANPNVLGNAEILRPIFKNLIDNSVKYNENETVSININYELKEGMHDFEIKDNGIGIIAEYHSRIFEMFKRLNVRNAYNNGSGLGLSIVKKLAERIGGDISLIRSEKNKGSTFLLSFPVSEAS